MPGGDDQLPGRETLLAILVDELTVEQAQVDLDRFATVCRDTPVRATRTEGHGHRTVAAGPADAVSGDHNRDPVDARAASDTPSAAPRPAALAPSPIWPLRSRRPRKEDSVMINKVSEP